MAIEEMEQNAKVTLREVRTYQTQSGIGIAMCRHGDRFGVVMRRSQGVAYAPNYKSEGSYLQTFAGNEADIIDWVDQEEAGRRYAQLVLAEMNRRIPTAQSTPIAPARAERCKPALTLIYGRGG